MKQAPDFLGQEVKRGYWLYDGLLHKTVLIFCVSYDYYYELDNDGYADKSDEIPELNEKGESYVVRWPKQEFRISAGQFNESFGGLSLSDAIKEAESLVQQKIDWLT